MGMSQSSKCVLWAAQDGRLNDLIYHLQGAGPEALEPSGWSEKHQAPIHLAAIRGHTKCIRVLREAGSKLNGLDKEGFSPLHLAVAHSHYGSMQVLLQLGASVNRKNRFGVTPLHIAASTGHTPCIEELARWGGDINAQESWGQSPLIISTQKCRVHCMKTLIHMGASTETKDYHHGNTALHVACANKDEESVLILLDACADVLATNAKGQSPMGVALANKSYHFVPLLLEYGARLNQADRKHLSQKLQDSIDEKTGSALSLQRLSRVKVRQLLGPAMFDHLLPTLPLSPSMLHFMAEMMPLCEDGAQLKEIALRGGSEEYWQRQEADAAAAAANGQAGGDGDGESGGDGDGGPGESGGGDGDGGPGESGGGDGGPGESGGGDGGPGESGGGDGDGGPGESGGGDGDGGPGESGDGDGGPDESGGGDGDGGPGVSGGGGDSVAFEAIGGNKNLVVYV